MDPLAALALLMLLCVVLGVALGVMFTIGRM
jgi:hypothetical protein